MRQITLNVENDKYLVFKAFIESLDYARIVTDKEKQTKKKKEALLNSIQTGLDEVALIQKGALKAIPLKDLLNEL